MVAVGVVGAFIVVVFVDEDAFLVDEELVAVPAPVAFAAQVELYETIWSYERQLPTTRGRRLWAD